LGFVDSCARLPIFYELEFRLVALGFDVHC
jgi:hypothetical protein